MKHTTSNSPHFACLGCAKASCKAGCPVGNDIAAFIDAVNKGEYRHAVDIVGHPLGGVCGSICPQTFCRAHCVRARNGEAVEIGKAEELAYLSAPYKVERRSDLLDGVRCAVVGGGVCGITFAVKCYEQGANVTVFEQNELLDTLYSIPSFRLEHRLLDNIVAEVLQSGISVVKKHIGSAELARLSDEFDCVLVAVGARQPIMPNISGAELAVCADDFLRSSTPCNAVIIGGGNTAIDCARKNARLGGKSVVAYRRSVEEMPAFASEISAALSDGVVIQPNLAPKRIARDGNGLCVDFNLTQSQNRGKLTMLDDVIELVCDTVVIATGNVCDSELCADKYFVTASDGLLRDNVYVGGDAAGGSFAATAVADAIRVFNAVMSRFGALK